MTPIKTFSLLPHDGPYETWGGVSQLLVDGVLTEHRVPGYILLHQFSIGDGYLLLLNYDCPYEESVVAVRLDIHLKVVTQNHFGFMNTIWDLEDISIEDPWTIDLYFGGGPSDWYRLKLIEGKPETRDYQITKS